MHFCDPLLHFAGFGSGGGGASADGKKNMRAIATTIARLKALRPDLDAFVEFYNTGRRQPDFGERKQL
jgi:hypothetical protein